MKTLKTVKMNRKSEREIAAQSFTQIDSITQNIHKEITEIRIDSYKQPILIPLSALKGLSEILKEIATENKPSKNTGPNFLTTQQAATIIGCSRPYLVKLLEAGKIAFTKIGKHRRIMVKDLEKYQTKIKQEQKKRLIKMMQEDESAGLYDA